MASFDIGERNFCVYMETFPFHKPGVCRLLAKVDLRSSDRVRGEKASTDPHPLIRTLITFLDSIRDLLYECDCFLIEKQLYTKNPRAVYLQCFLHGYLEDHIGWIRTFLVSPREKTKRLHLPSGKGTAYQRKKIVKGGCIEKAKELLREDPARRLMYPDILPGMYYRDGKWIDCELCWGEKRDDYSDTICQLHAFRVILGI